MGRKRMSRIRLYRSGRTVIYHVQTGIAYAFADNFRTAQECSNYLHELIDLNLAESVRSPEARRRVAILDSRMAALTKCRMIVSKGKRQHTEPCD